MKRIYIITCLLLTNLVLFGQDTLNIIPPSPSLQNLMRYGDYPVEPYTGMTDVSIPLWTVQSGDLSVPVGISCHASGRKVNDVGGSLGLGWDLRAGGFVSRTINNLADEVVFDQVPYINKSGKDENGNSLSDSDYYVYGYGPSYYWWTSFNRTAGGSTGSIDAHNYPDIFSYCLPSGKSGNFIIATDDNGDPYAMTIPYDPVKVIFPSDFGEAESAIDYYQLGSLKIIDTDGTQYWFGVGTDGATATDYKELTQKQEEQELNENYSYKKYLSYTGWYLCSMVSATGSDTICFEYDENLEKHNTVNESFYIVDVLTIGSSLYTYLTSGSGSTLYSEDRIVGDNNYVYQHDKCVTYDVARYHNNVLSKIKTKQGEIQLSYVTACNDTTTDDFYLKNLNEIEITNSDDDVLRSIQFHLSKEIENTDDYVMLLDSIDIYDSEDEQTQQYRFTYYESSNDTSKIKKLQQDWWGYYNKASNSYLIPADEATYGTINGIQQGTNIETITVGHSSSTNRDPNVDAMERGMLKSVSYPTGGNTAFTYEANEFFNEDDSEDQTCGGLRVKTIISSDGRGSSNTKTYTYSYGVMRKSLYPIVDNLISDSYGCAMFGSTNAFGGTTMEYRQINYTSDLPSEFYEFQSNLVYYESVKEYFGSTTQNTGYISYIYSLYDYYSDDMAEEYYLFYKDDAFDLSSSREEYPPVYMQWRHAWEKPVLNDKTVYKGSSSIEQHEYTYEYLAKDSMMFVLSHRMLTPVLYNQTSSSSKLNNAEIFLFDTTNYEIHGTWGLGNCTAISGAIKLKEEITYRSYDNTTVETVEKKYYDYESENLMLSGQAIVNSNGDSIYTTYTYPFQLSTTPYTIMSRDTMNIISPVISKVVTNNSFWDETKTNYYQFGTRVIKPQTVTSRSSANTTYRTLLTYTYDTSNGNIWTYTSSDGLVTNILWGYDNTYPVAKIVSGSSLTISSTIRSNINSHSFYGTETKSQIDTDITYLAGQLSTYVTSDSYQVTLYTYKPLVGMTSETQFNGKTTSEPGTTTYYIYDNAGQLSQIKNDDANLLKKYTYHYVNN